MIKRKEGYIGIGFKTLNFVQFQNMTFSFNFYININSTRTIIRSTCIDLKFRKLRPKY